MDNQKLIKAFERNGFNVSYFESTDEAVSYINCSIDKKTVGFGDSKTLTSLNLYKSLCTHNDVYDPQNPKDGYDFIATAKSCYGTEIYLTSANAISETGEIVNIDGTGNRIGCSVFGHKKVYFVVGTNKITATLDDAIYRARNIAAPQNAKRIGYKTPCAIKGDKCYNCNSPQRICNAMMVYFKCMDDMDMELVLINCPLGL